MAKSPRHIAFVSPFGGNGQTTLVANLATLLAQRHVSCVAIDLCEQNGLGLHLGLDSPSESGWAKSVMTNHWWAETALVNSLGVTYLPFGQLAREDLCALQQEMMSDSDWVREHLRAMALGPDEIVLLDVPVWPSIQAQQVLDVADLVIVCLEASDRSCKLESLVRSMVARTQGDVPFSVVITTFDPRRPTQCAALGQLRDQWAENFIPYIVHHDESIPAAFVNASCASAVSVHAQSVHDMQGIATWLLARCHMVELESK